MGEEGPLLRFANNCHVLRLSCGDIWVYGGDWGDIQG